MRGCQGHPEKSSHLGDGKSDGEYNIFYDKHPIEKAFVDN